MRVRPTGAAKRSWARIPSHLNSNAHPDCHAQNNIAVGNGASQIVVGPGSQSGNHTTGAASAIFTAPNGSYEDGDADFSLLTETGFAAAAGSALDVNLASVDYFGTARTTVTGSAKGAVES